MCDEVRLQRSLLQKIYQTIELTLVVEEIQTVIKKAKYRVTVIGRDYYSWQYDNEKGNGMDGYAGAFGRSMDRFQICPN